MSESEYIHRSHNVSVLLYHFVCPAKYRRVVFSKAVDESLRNICLEISKRYAIHFLIQSIHRMSPTQIITTVKSLTAREIFKKHPEVKEKLWGGEFWTDGYFVNTVSKFGDETSISKYVRNQGVEKDYKVLHSEKQ